MFFLRQLVPPSGYFQGGEHPHVHDFAASLKAAEAAAAAGTPVGISLPRCSGTSSSLVPHGNQPLAQQDWGQPWGQVGDREEQAQNLHLSLYFKSKNKLDKTTATFP